MIIFVEQSIYQLESKVGHADPVAVRIEQTNRQPIGPFLVIGAPFLFKQLFSGGVGT